MANQTVVEAWIPIFTTVGAVGAPVFILLVSAVVGFILHVNACRQRLAHQRFGLAALAVVEGEGTHDAGDDAVHRSALATLGSAQEAAQRLRRRMNVRAKIYMAACGLIGIPVIVVMAVFELPFGIVCAFIIAIQGPITVVLTDTLQRRYSRANISVILVQMLFILGFCTGWAAAFLSADSLPGIVCSASDPDCAFARGFFGALNVVCSVAICGMVAAFVPLLLVKPDRALPPVKELMAQQKLVIASSGKHPRSWRNHPAYLLEGANYFEVPADVCVNRFFNVIMWNCVVVGSVFISASLLLSSYGLPYTYVTWGGLFPIGLAATFIEPVMFSPPVRRAVTGWLLKMNSRGEEQQASTVAGLMGEYTAAKALEVGRATFTGLPFSGLNEEDLSTNKDTGLNQRIVPLKLGGCDIFMSHSWHDTPSVKWEALTKWAANFEATNGRELILWLDKACIDQQNIEASLACLPVYLAGCQQLLVLAGKTYIERLWCVVEVFTFTRMGGNLDRVEVVPLGDGALSFEHFAAQNAKCFKSEDKGRLLAAIEAAYGAHEPFNVLMRNILVSASKAHAGAKAGALEVLQA